MTALIVDSVASQLVGQYREVGIKALKGGMQRLVISVSLHILYQASLQKTRAFLTAKQRSVRVGATAAVHFVSANWRWLIATALAIGGLMRLSVAR